MGDPTLIRFVGLFLPLTVIWVAGTALRPPPRQLAGALLASAWCFPALLGLHALAMRWGWWRFQAEGGLLLGVPVDLYLGWVVLWGTLPAIALPRAPLPAVMGGLLAIDLLLMPLAQPVVQLESGWLVGELLGLTFAVLPAQLLARWTAAGNRLRGRVALIVIAFAGLVLGVLPTVVLELTGGTWQALTDRPAWVRISYLQALAIPAVLGLSAVQEFAARGRGTPIPFDPPTRIVRSGPYAYLANPMQLSMAALLAGWGLLLGSPWLALAGPMSVIFSAGLAAWSEGEDLTQRFGDEWAAYRAQVRNWLPRLRPWHPGGAPDRLYLAAECVPCSQLWRWFERRRPVGLEIVAAEAHPRRELVRLTYESADGTYVAEGIAAFARGLEHIHLGWAWIAWTLRLPGVSGFVQLLADAVGLGPRAASSRGG